MIILPKLHFLYEPWTLQTGASQPPYAWICLFSDRRTLCRVSWDVLNVEANANNLATRTLTHRRERKWRGTKMGGHTQQQEAFGWTQEINCMVFKLGLRNIRVQNESSRWQRSSTEGMNSRLYLASRDVDLKRYFSEEITLQMARDQNVSIVGNCVQIDNQTSRLPLARNWGLFPNRLTRNAVTCGGWMQYSISLIFVSLPL